ncbi:MAG: PAS domain S-box protein [Verrucomicrobiae bacterium]|nr:PAS domain S-box protein [Verrucomicrobiae bacterium]
MTPVSVPDGPAGSLSARTGSRQWKPDPSKAEPLSGREGVVLLDAMPCGVIVFDPDQNIRYANARHRDLLGRDVREKGMEPWLRSGCRDQAYADEVVRHWREYLWQKQLTRVFSLKNAADHLREIEFQPRLMEDGDLLLTIRDVTDTQQTEDALRLAETKWQSVFRHLQTGIAFIDSTGRFIDANPSFERLIGYSRGDLVRLGVADCVALADIERLNAAAAGLNRGQRPTDDPSLTIKQGQVADATLLIQLRPREGDLKPAHVRLVPVTGPQGRSLYTAMFVETDPEKARWIENADAKGRALLEAIPDLILLINRHGNLEEVIPPSGDWSGIEVDSDWIGKNLADCWPRFAERAAARMSRAIDEGETVSWRFVEGSPFDVNRPVAYSVRLAPGGGNLAVAVVMDVTDEMVAREALARQALAFRHLEEGIILTNLRGRILDWNLAAESTFGHSATEVRGSGLAKLYAAPGEEEAFNAELSRSLTEHGRWQCRTRFFRKDGSEGQADVVFLAVVESGAPRSLVGIHRTVLEEEAASPADRRWLDRWETLERLIAADAEASSHAVPLPMKIQARLRASRLVDEVTAPGERVSLAEYSRQLVAELLRLTSAGSPEAPVRFKVRADGSVTASEETASKFGLFLCEILLPAMVGGPQGEWKARLDLGLQGGHPKLELEIPLEGLGGLAEEALKSLAMDLKASVKMEPREGRAHWLVRFPAP